MPLQSRQEILIQCDYFPSDLAVNSSSKLRQLDRTVRMIVQLNATVLDDML